MRVGIRHSCSSSYLTLEIIAAMSHYNVQSFTGNDCVDC